MAMNYDITPLEVLKILGAEPSDHFEPIPDAPVLLNDFLSLAFDMELFETANIWTDRSDCCFDSECLKIGSDYSTGTIEFGIKKEELNLNDPPVYVLFEDDPAGWKLFSTTLSGFLMYIVCSILCCEDYDTAQDVLEKSNWTYEECSKPKGIAKTYSFVHGLSVCCGYEPDTNTLLAVLTDRTSKAYRISKEL